MRAAVLQNLSPPASTTSLTRRRSGVSFTILLLLLAFALVEGGRTIAPASYHRWFLVIPMHSLADIVLLLLSVFSAMLVHEAGHLIASVLLGFKILGGTFGPLRIQTLHRKWKFSLSFRTWFSASVSAIPTNPNSWRATMLVVIIGGPVATLGAAIYVANITATTHNQYLFQIAFVQVSLLLFSLGFIPTDPKSRAHNDARLFLNLTLQDRGGEETNLNVTLAQQVVAGVRPQDYPDGLLLRLSAWRGRPESELAFAHALVAWALDSGQIELAEAWDQRAVALAAQCSWRLRNTTLASSATTDVVLRNDLESALAKFAQVNFGALFPLCFEYRARAAYEFALSRLDRVSPLIIRAQYAIPRGVPAYDLDRGLLEKLHMKVLQQYSTSTGTKYKTASV